MEPRAKDDRPFLALGAVLLVVAVALALPATRGWMGAHVGAPLQAQVDPASGARAGYDAAGLAFWAILGAAFAWAAYELLFRRLAMRPDRAFFAALAPWLLFGPLVHALLAVGILRGAWAYPAAEPLVYLTTAALALAAILAGRAARRAWVAPALGLLALAPLLVVAAMHTTGGDATRVGVILALAIAPALALGYAFSRVRREVAFPAAALVVGAHALDGASTWMVLRDPFGLGFRAFGEKNPVSQTLVSLSNGWPYFAVKLALPLLLLGLVKADETEGDLFAFLLLAVFVLGWGPGMANLLQVMLA